MSSLRDEVRRIRSNLETLEESHRRFVEEEFVPLVIDGLQKSELTANQQRIRRIAAILAHALEVGPSGSTELAEEMMRIAMLLSDDDVLVLRTIYEGPRSWMLRFGPHRGTIFAIEQSLRQVKRDVGDVSRGDGSVER